MCSEEKTLNYLKKEGKRGEINIIINICRIIWFKT